MAKKRLAWLVLASVFVVSIPLAGAQNGITEGFYQIVSGTYSECCGFGGAFPSSLPNHRQSFVRLTVNRNLASMTFLGDDLQTVFSVVPCPGGVPIQFTFDSGSIGADRIIFHADPGPLPYALYHSYIVSNSATGLQINGLVGTAHSTCADVPTQFRYSNVVATLVPRPIMRITELSKEGALLFIQGQAGWTNVLEASTDLVAWTAISTNVMPATLCPICPYILVRDAPTTNLNPRFYRCFEYP